MFDIPRNLIYQERYSLDDFGVYDKGISYNPFLYRELLNKKSPTGSIDRTEEILSIFNTAYYLCTLFLIDPSPEARIGSYFSAAQYRNNYSPLIGNQIIALFYFYLYNMESYGKLSSTIDEFTDLMDKKMDLDVKSEIENLEKCNKGHKGLLVLPEEFALREVSEDLFNSVNWKDVTKNFSYNRIYFIAKNIYVDDLDKCNMLISICQQIKNDKDLNKEVKNNKEKFINSLKFSIIFEEGEDVDEDEKFLSLLIENEEIENYKYNLEEKYATLQNDYKEIEKECMELRKENEELKKRNERDKRMWVPHIEYARLIQENKRKDKRIEQLESTIRNENTILIDGEEAKKEGARELIEHMIKYAEKLSKRQSSDFLAIQNAILLVTRKLPNGVINDELEKRLENIGIEDDKPTTTNISTGGGPVIMGGKFDNTDFVAQKTIESK